MSPVRRIACVLLPFAAGYYLSFLFRSINALIAGDLTGELGLSAADLGLLTSMYFVAFAAVQLPCGVLLDRYGPRLVDSTLLLLAAAGSLLFALADGVFTLMLARALIGLGVAVGLMAGLKAIVLWFPAERVALANGWLIMLGALGALSATGPAEVLVQGLGWRGLFAVLAASTAAVALLILLVVPEKETAPTATRIAGIGLLTIYRDPRFRRIAPLAAMGVGTAFSLQGLWAAPWLTDVAGLDRPAVVEHLTLMAAVLSASALLLGALADRLRRAGIPTELFLAGTLVLSMAAQLALLLGVPISSQLPFAVVAAAGASHVLSFAALARYFPKEVAGRANAALGVLNMGTAFALQSLAGFIIGQWPQADGRYPQRTKQRWRSSPRCSSLRSPGSPPPGADLSRCQWLLPWPECSGSARRSRAHAHSLRGGALGVETACGRHAPAGNGVALRCHHVHRAVHRLGRLPVAGARPPGRGAPRGPGQHGASHRFGRSDGADNAGRYPTSPPVCTAGAKGGSMKNNGTDDGDELLWSIKTVTLKTGLSRATIYRYTKRKLFPPQRRIGPNRVGGWPRRS